MRRLLATLLALAFLFVPALVACAEPVRQARPVPLPWATRVTPGPAPGVPQVTAPVDPASYERVPCAVLAPEQAGSLGFAGPGQGDFRRGSGPSCTWPDGRGGELRLGVVTAHERGLTEVYEVHRIAPAAYFEPVGSVAGQPGVFADAVDSRGDGRCGLAVGLTDRRVLDAEVSLRQGSPGRDTPCVIVRRAAELAVATMRNAV